MQSFPAAGSRKGQLPGTRLIAWLAVVVAALGMLLLPASAVRAQALAQPPAPYQLNAGDELAVRFPLNPELDTTGPIGPDGRFTLPLLGRVTLAGLSLDAAEERIDTALREAAIVAEAQASITVGSYAGMVYVGGEVAQPGAVPITAALNPLQAIVEAGGLRDTARSRRIAVIRPAADGTAEVTPVNIREFIRAGSGEGGLRLQPGDIVFVPRSGIAEVNLFLDQYVNGLIPDAFQVFYNLGTGGSGVAPADPAP